ncbi:MAG: N-6 DNA methylase [Lachnospiraceae bacterium]|nr:N-6 DNA methylase [Lachnospiraceae bacterium]
MPDSEELSGILAEADIPLSAADEVLRMGGNGRGSILRVAAHFMLNAGDDAQFLKSEYGYGAIGIVADNVRYAVWFDENGMRFARGSAAELADDAAVVSWEQAAQRIKELVVNGNYAPQVILNQAIPNERKEVAESLWYLHQDSAVEFFMDEELFSGGFPDSTEKIAGLLEDRAFVSETMQGLGEFLMRYEEDRSIMRWHFHDPEKILRRLSELENRQLHLPLSQVETFRDNVDFVTEDEIDHFFMGGGAYSDGRLTTYSYYIQPHTEKEKMNFLKERYGTGGSSPALCGAYNSHANYDAKGVLLSRGNYGDHDAPEILLKWNKASERVERLILTGRYLREQDYQQMPAYESHVLAQRINLFYHNRDKTVLALPEGTDPFAHCGAIEKNLSDAGWLEGVISDMSAVLGTVHETDGMYEIMQGIFTDVVAFKNGEFSLFTPSREVAAEAQKYGTDLMQPFRNENVPELVPVYGYTIGDSVFVHGTEYEVDEIESGTIVLRDKKYPLFTYTYEKADLDALVAGNPLNSHLIVEMVEREPERERVTEPQEREVSGQEEQKPQDRDASGQKKQKPQDRNLSGQTEQKPERNVTGRESVDHADTSGSSGQEKGSEEIYSRSDAPEEQGAYAEPGQEEQTSPGREISDSGDGFAVEEPASVEENETPTTSVEEAETPEAAVSEEEPLEESASEENGLQETGSKVDREESPDMDLSLDDTEISGMDTEASGKPAVENAEDGISAEPEDGAAAEPEQEELAVLESAKESEYERIREKYRVNVLVGFEHNGYFEFYGEDAQAVADVLGTKILDKQLESGDSIPVTGFKRSTWASHGKKLWSTGQNIVLMGENEDGSHSVFHEYKGRDYLPIGMKLMIDNRQFAIDAVDFTAGKVSLRDITFQNGTGFPIFRSESTEYVRSFVEEQQWEQQEEPTPFDEPELEAGGQEADTVPDYEPENFTITDMDLGAGGQKTKFRMNMDAIRLLKTLEAEGRMATPDEQQILSKYVGWGGLPDAFDANKTAWANEYRELREVLTPEEYSAARSSTLNAHYTSPTVIRAMYDALAQMGFTGGNVLEPSMGVGNFFGMMPESMKDSHLYGVELDSITGRIAKQLYPKADITVDGFEKTAYSNDFFDVVIGNVPFGNYSVVDKKYDRLHFQIHDYFLAKAVDQVRPGGVVAVITSAGTMDKQNAAAREYLAQRADLLGAIRLPNNAFLRNAGTGVVSDILFLQKRESPALAKDAEWTRLGTSAEGFTINQYFADHPEMVLGTLTEESTQYGRLECTVKPVEGADLSEQLKTAVSRIHGTIEAVQVQDDDLEADTETIPADPKVKNFSYTVVNDQVYYRENSVMTKLELPAATAERVKGMVAVRDCAQSLIDCQANDGSEEEISELQLQLNTLYDAYTKKYGLLSSSANKRAFNQDNSYCLLCSLEVVDNEGNLERKADMFTKRTIKKAVVVTSVDTASEALAVSMEEKARVDLPYMMELTGKSEEELTDELRGVIFMNPLTDRWETADEYLSGNVRRKLETARTFAESNPKYAVNVAFLEQVQPKDLEASDIEVRIGATWIKPEYVRDFMEELFQTPQYLLGNVIDVRYSPSSGEWNISGKSRDSYGNVRVRMTYGTDRVNGYKLLEDALNLRDTRIFDRVEEDGKEKRVLNKKETMLAQQKQDAIKAAFKEWVFRDPQRRADLVHEYNVRFNSSRPREYDGSHITFQGMNPAIGLRPHQKNAVAHVLYGGNTLLAHCVGAGKTYEMVAAAMESKRLGLCQKSLFVVPNHLTEQWGSDFLKLYPGANILVATKKDFEPSNRKKFCARIATGDYDAVIIGHTQFERIPLSIERQRAMLQDQIDELLFQIEEAKSSEAEQYTIKQMEKTRKSLEAKLERLNDQSKKDDVVTFEQLGVDRLFVDESHGFKNLFLYTKMRNIAGIAQTEAQKSSDMFAKCRYMDEITGSRGITFATGTPVSNSMTELYTLMRYLQYDRLMEMNLGHFDSWASTFGETVTAVELAPEGTGYRAKTRFAKFFNLPELMSVFKEAADIQTSDMLKLPVPEVDYSDVVLQPSEEQTAMVEALGKRAEVVRNGGVDSSVDNMLKITNDGRKLALDQRLNNPMLPDNPNSKTNACVERVFGIWQETAGDKAAQLVFCDLSTPKGDGEYNVYDDLRDKLIEKGIPAEEIAFIHEANTELRKAELFSKVRSGQVRVLMGSTAKMGPGMNVQDRLIALHHLDVPWKPSDIEQQEGRIIRQGNMFDRVKVFRYITKGTFDAYSWQLLENKQKFISQIMTSKSPVRSADDIDEAALSYAEIKALATGNPYIKEKMDLDIQVAKLRLLKANYDSQRYRLEDDILVNYPKSIAATEERIAGLKADQVTAAEKLPADTESFRMEVGGKTFDNKKEAGLAIIAACSGMKAIQKEGEIGHYAGFSMSVRYDAFHNVFELMLKGKSSYRVEVGTDGLGNITRINNALSDIPSQLAKAQERLGTLHTQMETAKAELAKPFAQSEELAQKEARLSELNALLNMDTGKKSEEPEHGYSDIDSETGGTEEFRKSADRPAGRQSVMDRLRKMQDKVRQPQESGHGLSARKQEQTI